MKKAYVLILLIATLFSCKDEPKKDDKLNIVTTTTMITDLVKNIGGDKVNVQGLMGSGVIHIFIKRVKAMYLNSLMRILSFTMACILKVNLLKFSKKWKNKTKHKWHWLKQ